MPATAFPPAQVLPSPSQSGEPTFHDLIQGSPFAMWIFDISNGEFLDANPAAVKQYGWSREEFLTMTAERVRPPEDFAHFRDYREQMESIAASNLGTTDMWLHTRKDGTRLWAETTWQLIQYRGRKAALETVIDRSAHVRTEEENRELAHALNLAADAIIVCNLDREVLFWNRGAERIYGWTSEEAVGRSVKELLNIDQIGRASCRERVCLAV